MHNIALVFSYFETNIIFTELKYTRMLDNLLIFLYCSLFFVFLVVVAFIIVDNKENINK